jgi:hypothetical protein
MTTHTKRQRPRRTPPKATTRLPAPLLPTAGAAPAARAHDPSVRRTRAGSATGTGRCAGACATAEPWPSQCSATNPSTTTSLALMISGASSSLRTANARIQGARRSSPASAPRARAPRDRRALHRPSGPRARRWVRRTHRRRDRRRRRHAHRQGCDLQRSLAVLWQRCLAVCQRDHPLDRSWPPTLTSWVDSIHDSRRLPSLRCTALRPCAVTLRDLPLHQSMWGILAIRSGEDIARFAPPHLRYYDRGYPNVCLAPSACSRRRYPRRRKGPPTGDETSATVQRSPPISRG